MPLSLDRLQIFWWDYICHLTLELDMTWSDEQENMKGCYGCVGDMSFCYVFFFSFFR